MKKLYFSIMLGLGVLSSANAAFKVEDLNITVNAANPSADLGFTIFSAPLYKVNYFPIQGAFSFTGLLNADINTSLLSESVGGGNNTPLKIYNNKQWERVSGYSRTPVWLMHNGLGFTSKFKGAGNQYVATRCILNMTNDTLYAWFLINLNAAGDELKIIKVGYDDEGGMVTTGTEGENAPATGIDEQLAADLAIFPNPVTSSINISLERKAEYFRILDMEGKEVASGTLFGNSILVDQLKSAVYVLEIGAGPQILRKKFVKE